MHLLVRDKARERGRAARAPPGVYNNCSVGHGNQIIAVPRAARSPSRQSQCSNTHFVTIAARFSSSYLDVKTKGGSEGGALNPNVGSRVPINTCSDVQISSLRVNRWVPLNDQNDVFGNLCTTICSSQHRKVDAEYGATNCKHFFRRLR